MTRRQVIVAIAAIACGPALVYARQEKKRDSRLVTVTLIVDGMT